MNPYLQAAMMQQMQGQEQQPQVESPISSGAMQGMRLAKQSFGMDEDEKRRALGMALMRMSSNLSRPGYGKGFGGALAAINAGFEPAMEAYNTERDRVASQNAAALKMAMAAEQRQVEMERLRQLDEERKNEREMLNKYRQDQLNLQERRLNELGEYRKGLLDVKRGGLGGANTSLDLGKGKVADISDLPEISKGGRSAYEKDLRGSSTVLKELSGIKKEIDDYKKMTKGSVFDPLSPYTSYVTNPVKDITGYLGHEKLEKERVARKNLDSNLLKFRIKAEKALKGGVLSEGMANRFENKQALPNLNEGFDVLEEKLNDIEKEAKGIHASAKYSLKSGRHVTPLDVESFNNPSGIKSPKQEIPIDNNAELISQYVQIYPELANESPEDILQAIAELQAE